MSKKEELFKHFKKRYTNVITQLGFSSDVGKKLGSQAYTAGGQALTHETLFSTYCIELSSYFIIELNACLEVIKPSKLKEEDILKFTEYSDYLFDAIKNSSDNYFDDLLKDDEIDKKKLNELRDKITKIIETVKKQNKAKIEIAVDTYNFSYQNIWKRIKDNVIVLIISAIIALLFGYIGASLGIK